MLTKILQSIAGFASKPLQTWQERKTLTESALQERATLKITQRHELERLAHEEKLAKAKTQLRMAEQGQQQDYDLDRIAMENMKNSWKDELVLVIFITPIVLAFIPSMQVHVKAGFDAIAEMPNWYMGIVVGMVVTIYGLRGLLKAYLNQSFTLPKVSNKQRKGATKASGHPNIQPVRD